MDQAITYNFDESPSREGTFTEKYDVRKHLFDSANVTPLWVADMDLPAPKFLSDARRERVGLYGGTFFGPAGEGWFRINCAHLHFQLYPAIDKIVEEFTS
ncbi:MAG TPA: hypothetical protein VKN62_11395 [Pelovirga sp.]|nr:hypothetical protein [Pelovirga sp.]